VTIKKEIEMQSQPDQGPLWPTVVMAFGVSATASWTLLLVYELGRIIKYVIS